MYKCKFEINGRTKGGQMMMRCRKKHTHLVERSEFITPWEKFHWGAPKGLFVVNPQLFKERVWRSG